MKVVQWIIKWTFILLLLLSILGGGLWFLFHGVQELFHKNLIEVPNFKGLSLVEVIENRPKGLQIEIFEKKKSLLTPKGHIVEQTPEAGDRVKEGRQILVTVSLGSDSISVPNLVGKSARKSNLILRNLGLTLGPKSYLGSSEETANLVLSQSPKAGDLVEKGATVSFLVSGNFSQEKRVPVLLGSSLNDALTLLESMDLKVKEITKKNQPGYGPDEVLEQYPPAGNLLVKGEKIKLLVNNPQQNNENKQRKTRQVEIKLPPGLKMQAVKIELMDASGSAIVHEEMHKPQSSFPLEVDLQGSGYLNLFVDKVFYKKIILGEENGVDHRTNGN
ncbi:MAG: PASTA domain-containing protein [Candidatus Cloacimonetes bacterium]|nr:PASTA domain-containing protein [Candidatus Cloacimonadota bacterium]